MCISHACYPFLCLIALPLSHLYNDISITLNFGKNQSPSSWQYLLQHFLMVIWKNFLQSLLQEISSWKHPAARDQRWRTERNTFTVLTHTVKLYPYTPLLMGNSWNGDIIAVTVGLATSSAAAALGFWLARCNLCLPSAIRSSHII